MNFRAYNELGISEETALILSRANRRSKTDWSEAKAIARIETNAPSQGLRFSEISEAMMEYMSESVFDYPLDTIIEIKWNAETKYRNMLGCRNQHEFANKNAL